VNDIQVVLRGNIASDLRSVRFDDGNSVTSFRLASTSSWFDRERNTWVDRRTTYVSVNCRRALANTALQSLHKGHPVVVTGRLWERAWTKDERSGRTLEVEAETVGHDLTFGVSAFTRVVRAGRDRHSAEEALPQEERGQEERDPNEAALYDAVRDIDASVKDVSGFPVLDDEPDGEGDVAARDELSATRGG